MHNEQIDFNFMNKIWGFIAILLILIFLGKTENAVYAENLDGGQQNVNANVITTTPDDQQSISFENKWVQVGVPLKVKNAPEDATFDWVITSADGSTNSFNTMENYYIPQDMDKEKLISVTINGNENLTASIFFSSLPVVYIQNDSGYIGVNDNYTAATMRMQENKEIFSSKLLYNGNIEIKLRGNSAINRDKRPFRINLEKKSNLLGLGEDKHWALLANDIDHTLMRNKLLYEFSNKIGMDYYSKSENVILIFNNKYYGVYQLCETVNLGSERVDIFDWEGEAEKAADAIIDWVLKEKDTNKTEYSYANLDNLDDAGIETLKETLKEAMCKDMSWITSPYTFSYDLNGDGSKESYIITDYLKLPAPTGGVLVEMGSSAFDGSRPSNIITNYSQPLYFKNPKYAITNPILYNFTKNYIQTFEYALHSKDFTYHENSTKYIAQNRKGGNKNSGYQISDFSAPKYEGMHYSQLFDMDSLVQNFIMCEYSMNWDSMKNSVYMYKDIDGLFKMGPEWDFDEAWGNMNLHNRNLWFPTTWHTTSKYFTDEQYYQTVQWNRYLIRDPYFLVRVYEKYKKLRTTVIANMIKEGGTIDQYAEKYREAAAANDAKWGYTYEEYHGVGFEESLKDMKEFIFTRVNWMDEQMSSLDSFMKSLGYYTPSKDFKITKIDEKTVKQCVVATAKVTDSNISTVTFQVNGVYKYTARVEKGKAVCIIPFKALTSKKKTWNVIQILAINKEGNYIVAANEVGNFTKVKSNYYVFYCNKDVIDKSAEEVVKVIKKQTTGYNIYLTVAGMICVLCIGGIVIMVRYKMD
jgi:CotH protein.